MQATIPTSRGEGWSEQSQASAGKELRAAPTQRPSPAME